MVKVCKSPKVKIKLLVGDLNEFTDVDSMS